MPKSFSTFSRVFIGTFRLKRKWTRLCKKVCRMADDADIIPGPCIFAVRLSFRCCHNKTHLWSILLFLSCGFRQTNVAACGQCGTLSGYYFFLNGRGCFADLYSSLIQGDGGGIAGIGIYVEYGAQHLCLHFIGRDDEGAVGVLWLLRSVLLR